MRQVLINALQDDILYSKITIQTSDSSHDIDCRPGDALALAVWTHVAILVAWNCRMTFLSCSLALAAFSSAD